MKRLLLLILLFSTPAQACDPQTYHINGCDPFNITVPDHALHVLGAFTSTVITQHILKSLGMRKSESIILSAGLNYLAWSLKEFEIDEFPSNGNNKGNMIGIGTGIVFSIVFD